MPLHFLFPNINYHFFFSGLKKVGGSEGEREREIKYKKQKKIAKLSVSGFYCVVLLFGGGGGVYFSFKSLSRAFERALKLRSVLNSLAEAFFLYLYGKV